MSLVKYSIEDVAEFTDGELLNKVSQIDEITDILIDSRRLVTPEGSLFFALVSKKNNGHKYLNELYEKGVRNFVVSENVVKHRDANYILVENTLDALQKFTAHHRKNFNIPVIGITGSNGKTIVKEWLFQLMARDKDIVRSPKSYNSQIGVPLSVWQMNEGHNLGIFEAGISEPDEMDKLQPPIMALVSGAVFPYPVRIDADAPGALLVDWQVVNMSPHKHQGYALQWFVMAAVLFVFYVLRCSNLWQLLSASRGWKK